jgi:predicted nucleotidyltransferase
MGGVGPAERSIEQAVEALRAAGARFAYLHGSMVSGTARPDSDVDVAAWWDTGGRDETAPVSFDVDLPAGIDLLVLNRAPLEIAGRVAVNGRLLFEDDAAARVRWEATTRKIYFDELPRLTRAHREFLESRARG